MLTDAYKRKHDYLRVSITDKCNLRCRYCMPPEGVELLPHGQVLRNEEFVRLIGIFVSLGVVKVRFTGGEPLVRKGFIDIVTRTRSLHPALELCLTTNGLLLGNYIDDLERLGVRKLNISLDTISRERYRAITARDGLHDVLAAIDRALAAGFFDVKVNAVLFGDTMAELDEYLDYFRGRDVTLRFIEKMPFVADEAGGPFLSSEALMGELRARGELKRNMGTDTNVALMYDYLYRGRYPMKIGVIPPLTQKFCSACNRLRITSDGYLKTCLHSSVDHDLKKLIREGADDDRVRAEILRAVSEKREGHSLDCDHDDGGCSVRSGSRSMSKIGG
ncbi:MAG TPA: GTP 3',8-cyclase MoaA [Spirochaetota bacterium]|nr:GTP 3',8-cyclase MoaA [Spirochaetota bacterium]HQF09204.1 GTP 3',8-cyclase MoaA [Spirochaetota bacterium]HQH97745.1 GTP 3',8-cyclase MoaA [Spirochaetota bacterium]